jgi:hypothetical protein
MTPLEGITLAIAALGAILGIINTWQSIDRDRVKLRVSARVGYFVGPRLPSVPQIGIEVVNDSTFALTISQVGFNLRGSKKILVLMNPIIADGGGIPRRLEARSGFTAYFDVEETQWILQQAISRAYANTDSGEVRHSSRRALRKLVESLSG